MAVQAVMENDNKTKLDFEGTVQKKMVFECGRTVYEGLSMDCYGNMCVNELCLPIIMNTFVDW